MTAQNTNNMHWTPHSSLGIATIVFYAPTLVASIALLYIHGSPRMAWFFLTLMCCSKCPTCEEA